jgi:hypothetical protein
MALRDFTDTAGQSWQVWDTIPGVMMGPAAPYPSDHGVGRFSPGRDEGWLTFMAGSEKRRLSPIPAGWDVASEAELAEHLAHAEPVHLAEAAARILDSLAGARPEPRRGH